MTYTVTLDCMEVRGLVDELDEHPDVSLINIESFKVTVQSHDLKALLAYLAAQWGEDTSDQIWSEVWGDALKVAALRGGVPGP